MSQECNLPFLSAAAEVCTAAESTTSSKAASIVAAAPRPPPTLALAPGSASRVEVRRGWAYLRCAVNQSSSLAQPCEPGVTAVDEVDGPTLQDRASMG